MGHSKTRRPGMIGIGGDREMAKAAKTEEEEKSVQEGVMTRWEVYYFLRDPDGYCSGK